jgi:hypothetical protein
MPGYSDYTAENNLNWVTGQKAQPVLPSIWLALFTVAPTSDAGTGGTECAGSGYARVQVAGTILASAATTSGGGSPTVLHITPPLPSWIVAGMTAYDSTTAGVIPAADTIASTTSATITLVSGVTSTGVASGDTLVFSAWSAAVASSGTEPSVVPVNLNNVATITFPAATGGGAGFGTVQFFGLYDASGAGNFLMGDYLGNYAWLPATISNAASAVVTAHAHGYSAADPIVFTVKYGGTLPTFSNGNLNGVCTVVGPATDTFTVTGSGGASVNTSSTGDFLVRKILQQSIPSGVTASFAIGTLPLYAA